MIEKIFEELFGEDFNELFNNSVFDESKDDEKDEEKEDTHTYYHKVCDKYEDGKRVSHVEKEVKDGKVLKDVKDTPKIEAKCDAKCIGPKNEHEVKQTETDKEYEKLSAEYKKLKAQHNVLAKEYNNMCDELYEAQKKLDEISRVFGK
jgi:hypothetical protein